MSPLPVDMMDGDWRQVQHSASLRRRFDAWREIEPALAAFQSPAGLVRFLREPGAGARKDEILCALLARARGEPLAGRVVLEAVLPGLKNIAGRLLVDVRDREELWSVLLACAWEQIRTYPVARRPRRVAANLLFDCLRGTLTALAHARRDPAALASELPHELEAAPTQEGVDALLDRAVGAGALSRNEAELLLATRTDGVSLRAFAQAEGSSFVMVRQRRSRAERRLRFFLGGGCHTNGVEMTFLGCSGRRCNGPLGLAGGNDQSNHEGGE
jgi:DNA-directed RNA polymerase specialized sigma24 family protein